MRLFLLMLLGCVASFVGHAELLPAKDTQASGVEDQAAIDALAEKIFTGADRNHNHFLNRDEFSNAEQMLEGALNDWGRAGMIGKPKKKNAKEDGTTSLDSAATKTSLGKLSRSNKVSQAEFSYFVHTAVEQADEGWRQYNAATAAQQKIIAAQRKAMSNARGRGRRMAYPYYYPQPY